VVGRSEGGRASETRSVLKSAIDEDQPKALSLLEDIKKARERTE